jgi:phospholipid-binding lipoprotein MlaA
MIRALLALLLLAAPAQAAEPAWLDAANRWMHGFNQRVTPPGARLTASLERLPPEWREGARNLAATWAREPMQAGALALVGRADDAWHALRRVGLNIRHGQGGWQDHARAQGLAPATPADLGLALCAMDVPAGPYVVLPLLGGRTLRDALVEIAVAQAVLLAAPLQLPGAAAWPDALLLRELLASAEDWAAATPDARAMGYDAARAAHIAARKRACEALRRQPAFGQAERNRN